MDENMIARINELARKKKTSGLSPIEQEEQDRLRKAYLAAFRKNLRGELDNIVLDYPDGRSVPLQELKKKQNS